MVKAGNTSVDTMTRKIPPELDGDLVKGVQDVVSETINSIFQARGLRTPEIIRDKRSDRNNGNLSMYAIIGLKPPYEIGGSNVVAELNLIYIMGPENGNYSVYAKMPGCDGFNVHSLEEIGNGLVQSYTRQVHRDSMNL